MSKVMPAQIPVDRFLRSNLSNGLNIYERMLLVMIASFTGNKIDCYPSEPNLSKVCGMSVDSVKRYIKSLQRKELVKIHRSHGSNNHYELTIPSADSTQCSQPLDANSAHHLVQTAPIPSADSPSNNISNNIKEYTSSLDKSKKSSLKNKQTTFPESFVIEQSHKEKATHLGLDVNAAFEHFKEHHIAKGSTFVNWGMAFHIWLRNAAKFSQKQKPVVKPNNIMAGAI